MELKNGRDQPGTERGTRDWRSIDLSQLCTLQRGFDLTEATRKPGSVPVYSSSGISYYHAEARVQSPGVVTGRKGLLGKVFYIQEPFWPHDTTLWVKDFKGNEPAFVALILEQFHLEKLDAATSVPTLNRNNLAGHEVVVPPTVDEQRRLVHVIQDADALIECLEQLLAKKRQIKQGAMQELLTGKKRLVPPTQGTKQIQSLPYGAFPADWKPLLLSDVCAFVTKGSTPTTYGFRWQDDGVLFLRSECVSQFGLDLQQSMFIGADAHRSLRRSEVHEGDILITITGNVGRVVMLPEDFGEANINQHIARIRVNRKDVNRDFLFHFLSQPAVRYYYELITTGQAYPQISLKQVRTTELPLPDLEEQVAIASTLSDLDEDIGNTELKLAKARQLKQGMMQELLTGRIRLV